jgi:precorrin-2 methylase
MLVSLQSCDIVGWKTRAAALPTRCAAALAEAIREAKPKARRISLPSATIETAAELEAWLSQVRETIEKALRDGPAIL